MSEARGGYANGTLVGNWYEDRLDEFKNTHPLEHRMGRTSTTPIKMTRPVDDQYVSMNRAMHNWPVNNEPPPPPKMVNFATVRHGAEAPVPAAGYGSVLPRHGADRDLRVLSTTSHSVHGGAYADHPMMRAVPTQEHRADPTAPAAGKSGYEQSRQPTGVHCGVATGEMLKAGSADIKEHTLVQRSWMYDRSINQHYTTDKRPQAPTTNVPGLAIRGLGEASTAAPAARSFALANDTTRHDTGIWSG